MKIALIHATQLSMAPIERAFERHLPEAQRVNILDDSLSRDRLQDATLTEDMHKRIMHLAQYAYSLHVDAILFTCSAFGEAIDLVARHLPCPVYRPNQSMLQHAAREYQHIGIVTSFSATQSAIEQELQLAARLLGKHCYIVSQLCDKAMPALAAGDVASHDQYLLAAGQKLLQENSQLEVILLAQYSTARAADLLHKQLNLPVLTSPDSAVLALKAELTHT